MLKIIEAEGNETKEQLKKLKAPVEVVFAIPMEWQSSGKTSILRTHTDANGSVSTVQLNDLDDDATTYTVRTDEFSIYTLVFVPSQEAIDALPKTGDSSRLMLYAALALAASVGLASMLRRKRG